MSFELRGGFETGGDQFGFDIHHAGYRFMSMVGTDDQQDVVARPASPIHRIDHRAGVAIRLAQHGKMLG